MSEAAIRLYLDENVSPKIAKQLQRKGIEVVTAAELGVLGDSDENHFARAARLGYVLCTHDVDFLRLAAAGGEHRGIVFGIQGKHTIGDWVNGLELICQVYSAEDLRNHVEYL